jgi:hypothetical protein
MQMGFKGYKNLKPRVREAHYRGRFCYHIEVRQEGVVTIKIKCKKKEDKKNCNFYFFSYNNTFILTH